MERLKQRLSQAQQALVAFNEVLAMPFTKIVRDAAIQRFEFTVEAVWKFAQLYLREKEGLDLNSPKSVMRGLFEMGILTAEQTQLALSMIDERNLTVHTYNEELAQKIYQKTATFQQVLQNIVATITNKI